MTRTMAIKRLLRFPSSFAGNAWRYQLLLILTLSGVAASVMAQEFRADLPDEKIRAFGAKAKTWTADAGAYAADQQKFAQFFTDYYFPDMTKTGDADLARLGDSRTNIFKRYLWATANPQLQKDLTDLALERMKGIVTAKDPPYHPAVRYNAVLVLGMLDEQYAIDSGAGRRPPKPLPAANTFLTLIVNLAADDKPVPPGVAFGALIGLDRHAQFHDGLPPDAIAAMSAALLKLVNHDKPIQEMDRDAYSWMRLRAASALAKLGSVGDKNVVHNSIVKLAASGRSLDDRCEAAALLEKITYKDIKLDDAGTAEPLFGLVRDVAAAEDKRAQEFQDSGATGSFARSPGGPEGYAAATPGVDDVYPRRSVLARLYNLRTGLTKVKPALPAETQKKVDAVLAALAPAIAAASNKDTVPLRVADSIRTMADAVNKAIPAAEKPADKAKENEAF